MSDSCQENRRSEAVWAQKRLDKKIEAWFSHFLMQTTQARFENVKKIGTHTGLTQDLYHSLLVVTWRKFFLFYFLFFVFFNLIFAIIYSSVVDGVSGVHQNLWHAFCFSVQTFSTVGYGVFAPQTDGAHFVVVIEAILSVFVTAVLTGLIFAKFSRPSAKFLFSDKMLINNFDGQRTMMLRIGNLRSNLVAEAQVRMVALKSFVTKEGETIRRQIDLKLVRSSSLFFALTWTVMHVIDETSPFFGLSSQDIIDQNIEVGVSVIGYDSTFSQSVHANALYSSDEIIFDRYFADVMSMKNNRVTTLDYTRFNDLKNLI